MLQISVYRKEWNGNPFHSTIPHAQCITQSFEEANRHFYNFVRWHFKNVNLFQTKLLTTALSEKFEELRQAREELRQTKKEYDLVMQERKVVHHELQEQTTEIEMLKTQNKLLQEQLNIRSVMTNVFDWGPCGLTVFYFSDQQRHGHD